jgi:hypothetical protein
MAERGVFVYDWTDVHRTIRAEIRAYELVARPSIPVTVDALPDELARIAKVVTISAISFSQASQLDIRAHAECRQGAPR